MALEEATAYHLVPPPATTGMGMGEEGRCILVFVVVVVIIIIIPPPDPEPPPALAPDDDVPPLVEEWVGLDDVLTVGPDAIPSLPVAPAPRRGRPPPTRVIVVALFPT